MKELRRDPPVPFAPERMAACMGSIIASGVLLNDSLNPSVDDLNNWYTRTDSNIHGAFASTAVPMLCLGMMPSGNPRLIGQVAGFLGLSSYSAYNWYEELSPWRVIDLDLKEDGSRKMKRHSLEDPVDKDWSDFIAGETVGVAVVLAILYADHFNWTFSLSAACRLGD